MSFFSVFGDIPGERDGHSACVIGISITYSELLILASIFRPLHVCIWRLRGDNRKVFLWINTYHIRRIWKGKVLTDAFRFGQDVYRLDLTNLTWKLLVFFKPHPIVILYPVFCWYFGLSGVHRRTPSAQGFSFSYSHRFEILILFGSINFEYVPWPLFPRLLDVHFWGAERPDWRSVARQHGAWLLQQQGQEGILNSEVDMYTPGLRSFTCAPIVRSRFLILPQNVKLTDILQVCYFDTTTFTWHNPSIEPPLPSGEWLSWMEDVVNLLEKTNEVAIQIDGDDISQHQLIFMMKLVWTFKHPMTQQMTLWTVQAEEAILQSTWMASSWYLVDIMGE